MARCGCKREEPALLIQSNANGLYLKNIAWASTNGINMLSIAPYIIPSKEMNCYDEACNVQKLWNGMSITIEMDYQDKNVKTYSSIK